MVYNKADQLIRWPGMHTYAYDGAGNLTQVKNDSETQVLRSYTYTPTGLLDTASFKDKDGNTRTLSNSWDADSNRVSFDANGTEYELVYDITAGIPAVLHEHCDGAGNDGVHYIREPGGSLIARYEQATGIRYYHFDELGSTRLLTDSTGAITDRYTYDAYGALLSHDRYSGSVSQPYQYVGQLGYYTHWMEPDFGLLQLGVRFYDPEVGRFTQRDPVFTVAQSDYLYCGGFPLSAIDPRGEAWWWPPSWFKPKPKPKPKPEDPADKAMKALAKWFMKSMMKVCTKNCPSGPEISLGLSLYDLFNGLPQKFRHALDVCVNSAKEICNNRDNEGLVWTACMDCYNAFVAAAGPGSKSNYYGSLISCEKLVEPRK